jgi:N-acetylmuramoyl-L-alanine amidase
VVGPSVAQTWIERPARSSTDFGQKRFGVQSAKGLSIVRSARRRQLRLFTDVSLADLAASGVVREHTDGSAGAGWQARAGLERFLGRPFELQQPMRSPHRLPRTPPWDGEQQCRVPVAAVERDRRPRLPGSGTGWAPAGLRIRLDPGHTSRNVATRVAAADDVEN